MRYQIEIYFKNISGNVTPVLKQDCKTLKEAISYANMIDDTVESAIVWDFVAKKEAHRFK